MKAIIEGEVLRVAKFGASAVEFGVSVSSTLLDGVSFTIGTEINCKVENESDKHLSFMGSHVLPNMAQINKPFEQASSLAAGDKIKLVMEKNADGVWKAVSIRVLPKQGQDVGEFLDTLNQPF